MSVPAPSLALAFGLAFEDLYRTRGLERIDAEFVTFLSEADGALAGRFAAARTAPDTLEYKAEAELLIAVAPHLDAFVAELFGIEAEWDRLVERHHELQTRGVQEGQATQIEARAMPAVG